MEIQLKSKGCQFSLISQFLLTNYKSNPLKAKLPISPFLLIIFSCLLFKLNKIKALYTHTHTLSLQPLSFQMENEQSNCIL